MYAYVYVCMYVCMYVCIYVCMYVCMDVCMYVCVYIYILCMFILLRFPHSYQRNFERETEQKRWEERRGERREERKHWNGGFHGFSLYAVLWSFAAHCLHFASQWLHQCCSLLLLPAWFYSALQLPACTALEWLRQRCSCCSCIGSSTLFRNSVLVVRIGVAASRWIQSLYVRWC